MNTKRSTPLAEPGPDCRVTWRLPSPASSPATLWMREAFGCAPSAPPSRPDEGTEFELQLALNADEARQLSAVAYAHMVKSYPGESFIQELALCQGANEIRAALKHHPELPAHWITADLLMLREKARQVIAIRYTGSDLLKALALAETPMAIEETFARCSSLETTAQALMHLRCQSGQPLPGSLTVQTMRQRQ